VSEMFRTVQSIAPPPGNAKMPCLNTLCRGAPRFSIATALMIVVHTILAHLAV